LEFNVHFQHKYGYIRDEGGGVPLLTMVLIRYVTTGVSSTAQCLNVQEGISSMQGEVFYTEDNVWGF